MPKQPASGSLLAWEQNLAIRPVLPNLAAHSLHTYFGVSPESPDGQWVLLFTSTQSDAQTGQLLIAHRLTTQSITLDPAVEVEDSHRQANQQWVCGGRYVVYMAFVKDQWLIVRVDPQTQVRTVLARGRQLGWGQPHLDVVPLYGPPWAPGAYHDLELLDVRTGVIRTVATAAHVVAEQQAYVAGRFGTGDRVFSIFFPTLSPDGRRVFFKLASPNTGIFRTGKASIREGLFVYDLAQNRLLGLYEKWGHPAWCADARHVQDLQSLLDTDAMTARQLPHLPPFNSSVHASPSPDGRLLAADMINLPHLPQPQHWHVAMIDAASGRHHILAAATAPGQGTTSWRPVHPHPSFNAAGNRLYFNLPSHPWTTLYVAEPSAQ